MQSTTRIAITGTDGTGKTTVIRLLQAAYAEKPDVLQALRAPQYHDGPGLQQALPVGQLSASIDTLNEFADRSGDLQLKATALFLSMTLYGQVERYYVETYHPRWLVNERQCLADSLVYARFYAPLVKSALDRDALEPVLRELLGEGPMAELLAWVPVFQAREQAALVDFWSLPLYARDLFSTPPQALAGRLCTLYATRLPDQIVLLKISPERLAERLACKRTAPRELHEQAHLLSQFQEGLAQVCALLAQQAPSLRVHTLDTSDQTPDQTLQAILDATGIERSE